MQLQHIAERCQQGDREAFALLYDATREQLRAVCLRYVSNESMADDLLHDAFLLIISKIGELKNTTCVESWMKTVTRRVALLYLRQQKQRSQVSLSKSAESSLQLPTEENHAESALAVSDILSAVNSLPEGYRRVFRLSVFEGMSHQEIASLLHIEPHSSSSQLFRAKAMLRQWLRPMLLVLLVVTLPTALYLCLRREHGQERQTDVALVSRQDSCSVTPPRSEDEGGVCISLTSPSLAGAPERTEGKETTVMADTTDERAADVQEDSVERHDLPVPKLCIEERGLAMNVRSTGGRWHIGLAYEGIDNSRNLQLPYADAGLNPMVYDSLTRHHLPLTVTLSISRQLDSHWQIGTGLSYTRLRSDFASGNSYVSLRQRQTVSYLGLPLNVSRHWQTPVRRLRLYGMLDATIHLPLSSTLDSYYLMPNGSHAEPTTENLHPGVQWSAGLSLGLQYDITPHVSLIVQPGVQHYFQNNSGISTWNTAHPLVFTLPLGVRVSF